MCSKLTIKTPEQRLINFYSPEIIKKTYSIFINLEYNRCNIQNFYF